jgi:hypothetical protein
MTKAYVDQYFATKADPTFTGTMTIPSGTAITSAALATPVLTAPTGTGFVVSKTVAFTENATNTIHTGTVTLPSGAHIHDVRVVSTVLWTGGTATMKVGDGTDDDGWFTGVNLKATDLLVGEVLSITNSENWGGKQGAYLDATTGRKGVQTGGSGTGNSSTGSVIGVITVGTPATTAGRTFMTVTYSVGETLAAVATGP